MSGADDQGRAGKPPRGRCDDRILAAVGIEHVKAASIQNATYPFNARHDIDETIHEHRVDDESGIPQPGRELRIRLADCLKIMPPLAHGDHFLEDAMLLPTETRGGLGMHDTQGAFARHQ